MILNARSFNKKYYRTAKRIVGDYSTIGKYFDLTPIEKESDRFKLENGLIPKVRYGKEKESFYAWNPVTVVQTALGYWNRYIDTSNKRDLSNFIKLCDWLIDFQRYDGSYRYEFTHLVKPDLQLEKGWVSAMAQGQILSAMARAWDITGDIKYLKCGKLALDFMVSSGETDNYAGTQKSLKDFVLNHPSLTKFIDLKIGQEYVTKRTIYVLNGDLFGLLGLYDWSQIATRYYGREIARKYLDEGVKAIEVLLPYYDYYGWSSYDLGQYTHGSPPSFSSSYAHRLHALLLDVLGRKVDSEIFKKNAILFWRYIDDEIFRQDKIHK